MIQRHYGSSSSSMAPDQLLASSAPPVSQSPSLKTDPSISMVRGPRTDHCSAVGVWGVSRSSRLPGWLLLAVGPPGWPWEGCLAGGTHEAQDKGERRPGHCCGARDGRPGPVHLRAAMLSPGQSSGGPWALCLLCPWGQNYPALGSDPR